MENYSVSTKILAWVFDRLYHQFAWSYDAVAWIVSSGNWQGWIRTTFELLSPKTNGLIIELGFGPGHLQSELARRRSRSIGIDESRQMSKIAHRRLNQIYSGTKNIGLVRAQAEYLPLTDGCADTVLATFPAEYIFHDQTIRNWRRVLTTNGAIIILMGVEPGGFSIISVLMRFIYQVTNAEFKNILGPQDYLDRIRAHGFCVEPKSVTYKKDRLWFIYGHKL